MKDILKVLENNKNDKLNGINNLESKYFFQGKINCKKSYQTNN